MNRASSTFRGLAKAVLTGAALGAALLMGSAAGAMELPEKPAYVAMLRADQLRDAGQAQPALEAYREALALFLKLAEERPDYKREIIARRIGYCRAQIAALESTLGTPAAPPEPPPAEAARDEKMRTRLAELERAFAQLQEAGAAAEQELTRLRQEREQLLRTRAISEERRRALFARLVATEQRLAEAERALEEARGRAEELERGLNEARKEADTLRNRVERVAELEARVAELTAECERLAGAAREAAEAREAAQRALAAAEEAARARELAAESKFEEERKALETERNALRAELEQWRQRTAQLEAWSRQRDAWAVRLEQERARRAAAEADARLARAALEQALRGRAAGPERGPSAPGLVPAPGPSETAAPAETTTLGPLPGPSEPEATMAETPSTADAWVARGREAMDAGDWPAAATAARAALQLDPKHATARWMLARIAWVQGDAATARRLAERLTRDARGHAGAELLLGQIAEQERRWDTALRHYRRAAELEPDNPEPERSRAYLCARIGRTSDAIEALRKVLERDPEDGRAHFNLAALLSAYEQRLAEAREHYERALELGEERDEALENRIHP